MPDEKPSQPIPKQSPAQAAGVPVSKNNPTSSDAAKIREEHDEKRIAKLEERMGRAEKIMAWLTGAIALFALASVIVGILQWSVLSSQLEDSEAAQRANLVLDTFEADWPSSDSPVQVHCSIWNAGQTTALSLSISTGGGGGGKIPLDKNGNRFLPPIAVNGRPNPSDAGPSLGQNQRRDCSWTYQFSPSDRDYTAQVRMGDVVQDFTVSVSYRDVFGKAWVVNDCLGYWVKFRGSGQGHFAHCTMQPTH